MFLFMKTYIEILIFNSKEFIQYRLDLISIFIHRAVTIGFVMLLWRLLLEDIESVKIYELASYYLVSDGIIGLAMVSKNELGSILRKGVKTGSISAFLLRPYKTLPALIVTAFGVRSIDNLISIIFIIAGIVVVGELGTYQILFFFFLLIVSICMGIVLNMVEGIASFFIVEPGGVMNALNHTNRLLSGALIPLNFFPDSIEPLVRLLPFSYLSFYPASAISEGYSSAEVVQISAIGLFWVVVLGLVVYSAWRRGIREYEAVGL
jgi:ABC-2 type transport system permease protein